MNTNFSSKEARLFHARLAAIQDVSQVWTSDPNPNDVFPNVIVRRAVPTLNPEGRIRGLQGQEVGMYPSTWSRNDVTIDLTPEQFAEQLHEL